MVNQNKPVSANLKDLLRQPPNEVGHLLLEYKQFEQDNYTIWSPNHEMYLQLLKNLHCFNFRDIKLKVILIIFVFL